jgi:ankyrin repeat protein
VRKAGSQLSGALLAALLAVMPGAAHAGSYEDFFVGVELDRPAIILPLLAKGFDVNARDPRGQHALYVALRENSMQVVDLLLRTPGLQADAVNGAGETPLMMAALRGHVSAMQRLIALGGQVRREGWTPLHYAASGESVEAAQLLIQKGADLDARAPNGSTPLMLASGYGGIDIAELLLKAGADPTLRNKAGLDAAEFARRGDRDALAAQLEKQAAAKH